MEILNRQRFVQVRTIMEQRLREEMPYHYTYHNITHILDVLAAAERIGLEEGITEAEMELLQVAVLFHDAGFLEQPQEHELASCRMAKSMLPEYGYLPEEINRICGMIMATRIPQLPENHLEQIICDADLDYLGREDFVPIGNTLKAELMHQGIIRDVAEWNLLQEKFLLSHQYHTRTALQQRQSKKEENLRAVMAWNRGH